MSQNAEEPPGDDEVLYSVADHVATLTLNRPQRLNAITLEMYDELEETVAPSLEQMVYGVGVLDLDAITTQIDDESKPVLDPEPASDPASPSESPSE